MSAALVLATVVIGLGIGFALQRGRGCTNSAFRNMFLFGNGELFTMIVIIVGVELVGYYVLSLGFLPGFNFVQNPIAFSWLFIPLGGFIFGVGTVFAGGCAGGTCYRVGEGKITSTLALLGFTLGIGIIAVGPLASPFFNLWGRTTVLVDGSTPALTLFLPRWFWTTIGALMALLAGHRYRKRMEGGELKLTHLLKRWNPILTGVVVGLLGVYARYISTLSGRPFGLSTTDGIADLVLSLYELRSPTWAGVFIMTLILGSAVAAIWGKEFSVRLTSFSESARYFGGGILLGVGAILGFGCNFGHIFGGIPELGISSFASVSFMILGNYLGSYIFYIRLGNQLPDSTPVSIR